MGKMEQELQLKIIIDLIEKKVGTISAPVLSNSKLEEDLGMTGDDASEFISEFSKVFNVDISNFDYDSYFSSEGDGVLDYFFSLIKGKKKKKMFLTISDLHESIKKGKLE
jgi:hypothetical protein